MKFVEPYILLLIPVAVIFAVWGYVVLDKRKRKLLTAVLGNRACDPQAVHLSPFRRNLKRFLLVLTVILLIFAAARPYCRTVSRDVSVSGSDVLILFDVSNSMRATDLPPSRMAQAKYLLREVFQAFPHNRFGIVPFAGNAFLSCPLTADHTALTEALEDLSPDSVPLGGTNIEKALQTAQRAFAGAEGSHRAVILLTDGDELSGNAAAMIAELKKNHIPVAVVGFGDPAVAAPVPDGQGGVMRGADGRIAGSKLNEATLRQIAGDTGGIYIRSQVSDTGFARLEEFLKNVERAGYNTDTHREVEELFPWFLAAALATLTLAILIPTRRNGKKLLLLLLIFALPAVGAEELALPDDPYELYAQGRKLQLKNDPAAVKYYEKAVQLPGTPDHIRGAALQNLGVMQHRDGRADLNRSRQELQAQKPDEAAKSAAAAKEKFARAQERYTRSMQFFPADKRRAAAGNFRQALRDHRTAEEMQQQIAQLKKLQQQAQQQTQQAQQQNRQEQNQQNQQAQQQNRQQQNQQDKQAQQQNRQQQNQQNQQAQQQNRQQQNQQQTQQARRAAEELARQAAKLQQQELARKAKEAAKKLEEARKLQQQGEKSAAQQKLNEAAGLLGEAESPQDTPAASPEQKPEPPAEQTPEQKSGQQMEQKTEKSDKERANERKLKLLDDEAETLRRQIQQQQRLYRGRVEKDW